MQWSHLKATAMPHIDRLTFLSLLSVSSPVQDVSCEENLSYSVELVPEQHEKQKPPFLIASLPAVPPERRLTSDLPFPPCAFAPVLPSIWNVLSPGSAPLGPHLKCYLPSEAFADCSTRMDLLLLFPVSVLTWVFFPPE